jgi:hypothetical protein
VELPLKIVFITSKLQEGIDRCTSIYSTVKVIGKNKSDETLLQHGEKCNLELHIFGCNFYLAREIRWKSLLYRTIPTISAQEDKRIISEKQANRCAYTYHSSTFYKSGRLRVTSNPSPSYPDLEDQWLVPRRGYRLASLVASVVPLLP